MSYESKPVINSNANTYIWFTKWLICFLTEKNKNSVWVGKCHAEGIQIEKPECGTAPSANRMTYSTSEGMRVKLDSKCPLICVTEGSPGLSVGYHLLDDPHEKAWQGPALSSINNCVIMLKCVYCQTLVQGITRSSYAHQIFCWF